MSSITDPIWGNQSLTSIPLWPYFLIANLQRINLVSLLAVGVVDDHDASLLQPFGILDIGKGSFVDRLAGIFGQRRLGIETLHVADTAAHEQPDHALWLSAGNVVTHRAAGTTADASRCSIACNDNAAESQTSAQELATRR